MIVIRNKAHKLQRHPDGLLPLELRWSWWSLYRVRRRYVEGMREGSGMWRAFALDLPDGGHAGRRL